MLTRGVLLPNLNLFNKWGRHNSVFHIILKTKTKTGGYVREDIIALNEGNRPCTPNFSSQLHTFNDLAPGKSPPLLIGQLPECAIEQSCFCWQLKTRSQTEFAELSQLKLSLH